MGRRKVLFKETEMDSSAWQQMKKAICHISQEKRSFLGRKE